MAIIQSGSGTTDLATVSTMKAMRVHMYPLDPGTLGAYRYAGTTGTLAATLAAGAVIFAFRNSGANPCIVTSIKTRLQGNVAFTAAAANLALGAYVGRSFTGTYTGGTGITPSGNLWKMRTSQPTSGIGDLRIATTVAFTGGTITVDTYPFAYGGPGRMNNVNAAAGTEFLNAELPGSIDFAPDMSRGEYPLVCVQNEGFVIRNEVVWPAAGTGTVSVEIAWTEVASF
jgi:hypothetical protein